jgi:hypothetical protein
MRAKSKDVSHKDFHGKMRQGRRIPERFAELMQNHWLAGRRF